MSHSKTIEIAIVGAGFSGLMTAYHLIREASSPIDIHIINPIHTFGRGAAYSTQALRHLLNVPAAKMSALYDDPAHFLNWIHQHPQYKAVNKDTLGKTFLPRKLFGDYFNALWEEALKNKRADTKVEFVHDSAVDIEQKHGSYTVKLKSNNTISADYVILATGNESPGDPPIAHPAFYRSNAYIKNPWLTDVKSHLNPGQDILILGNGLTMVDIVISIKSAGYTGQIHTVSPSGFAVLPHRHNHLEYPDFVKELQEPYTLNDIRAKFKKHRRMLHSVGLSVEPLVDSLRPLTHKIWGTLSTEDKKTFIKDLRTPWGKVRHRLAPQLFDYIQNLRLKNELLIHKGRLIDITEDANGIDVSYQSKRTGKTENLHVGLVVNCTGPHIDITKSEDPLLQALVTKGMIQPDSLRIGMDVTDQWLLKNAEGKENPNLYTIGGNLRGLLWETTAIPELRTQAAQLAKRILSEVKE